MTTTTQDDGFGDAEHATATPPPPAPPKVPDIVQRIGEPPRGVFTKAAPRRAYLVEQVITYDDGEGVPHTETRGVIGRGQLHIIAGEGGAGKGRWLLAIAAALAAGDSRREPDPEAIYDPGHNGGVDNVCGLNVIGIEEDEKVLVLLGEDDATDIHQRFEGVAEALGWKDSASREDRLRKRFRWGSAHGLTFSIVNAKPMPSGRATAEASADFNGLTSWLRENGPWAFIALDPMARFAGVDENDNPLQTQVYALVEGLTKVNGEGKPAPAVVVVDHTGKPNNKGSGSDGPDITQHAIRGASAKVNAARVAMLMMPGGTRVDVDCEGRKWSDPGFDETDTASVGVGDVMWHVVKNNGQQKAKSIALSFTKHGGLLVESPADARARQKRQFHAAKQRKETSASVEKKRRPGKTSTTSAIVDAGGDA